MATSSDFIFTCIFWKNDIPFQTIEAILFNVCNIVDKAWQAGMVVIYRFVLTFKAPRKSASENVVCCIFLQTFQTYFLHIGKQCGPDQTAPRGAV